MRTHAKFVAAWLAFCVLLLRSLLPNAETTSKSHNFETYTDNSNGYFTHLAVDHDRGLVYVGGMNRLYQFSPDLKLISTYTTGPVNDDPKCSILMECPSGIVPKPTNNHNKALVIGSNRTLIACGSTRQGMCTIHSLENISNVTQVVKEMVVANDANASTVTFIAQGPKGIPFVLYVGATFTGNSVYRSEVPAIASRSLDPNWMLQITGTPVLINNAIINYIFGFSSGLFSYFLTMQKAPGPTLSTPPYISKLMRIRHSDTPSHSYIEMPIECGFKGSRPYNLAQAAYVGKPGSKLTQLLNIRTQEDVLFVIFSRNRKDSKPTENCALCIYSLSMIERNFQDKCSKTNNDVCSSVEAVPIQTFRMQLTSVAATSTNNYTVVFIGTKDGHLKKLVVKSMSQLIEYSDLVIDEGSTVNSNMVFDAKMNNLYVMTERRVTKVEVQECSRYKSCWDCLKVGDPYCGWCSLENRCTLRSKCQNVTRDPLMWIPYTIMNDKCPTIRSVSQNGLQRTAASTLVQLVIENLPPLTGQFLCEFGILDKTLITNATRNSLGVECATPHPNLLPSIPPGQHFYIAKISVKTNVNPKFVEIGFTFFDCSTFISCSSCVLSNFACDWCLQGHQCTHDRANGCRNDTVIKHDQLNYGNRSHSCPSIDHRTVDGLTEILVPSGMKKRIYVKIPIRFRPLTKGATFLCQFNIGGNPTRVSANLTNDTICCDDMEFQFTQKGPNTTATFAVIMNGTIPLENPDNIHVAIYRCHDMADNCGMCLMLDKKYSCGWCRSTNRCEIVGQCDRSTEGWLDRNHTCPKPSITSFSPESGPWIGGTNITIEGINLGRSYKDVNGGITVSGISCKPYQHLYRPPSKIVCRVDGLEKSEARQGPVMVKIDDFRCESNKSYSFVDPKIESVFPRYGPQSGGTVLSIHGKYLNAGNNVEVWVDELQCHVQSVNSSELRCVTKASERARNGTIEVKFDGSQFDQLGTYEYKNDPTIEHFEWGPKGIQAGGINISVRGTYLRSVQEIYFCVYDDNETQPFSSKCEVHNNTMMTCYSPHISSINNTMLDAENPKKLDYAFKMDGVTSVDNISTESGFSPFLLYPNPTFDPFPNNITDYEGNYPMTIHGQNIDRACQKSDVRVQVGNRSCEVISLSNEELICRPPNTTDNPADPPEVIVSIGENFRANIGKLSYSSYVFWAQVTQIGYVGVPVLISVFVAAVFVAYRRKSAQSYKELKNVHEQMDKLELSVAAECKDAFAEFQIEKTDFTLDISSGGIPFLDYRSYTAKILFPGVEDPSFIQREKPELDFEIEGLRLFGQLVMNKTFLLQFVRTLESNAHFSMNDRVNVASTIMITLQSKMEYCTDILKTLLTELIERSLEGKPHPKLLLRRTGSVVEKMLSAWFTFLLYKFLREYAGEPLYTLFCAVKQQVNKGPVDAITSEARYSLNETKLIRQRIDYRVMTVYVSISQKIAQLTDLKSTTEHIPVKVLDCDTISQVKEKALDAIYRATPHSQRPCPSQLSVEWCSDSGRLILYDDDITSKAENEWKKMNTLNHYEVPDGSFLNLVSLEQSSNNYVNLSTLSTRKWAKFHNDETLKRANSCNTPNSSYKSTSTLTRNNHKAWHLVKHYDSNEKHEESDCSNKMVSEIYLTRLLATKDTLQKFVDDLFETIFSVAPRASALPFAIKYMFDFLDERASFHGITDPEVVHTWKNNSLPLRFWVNIIKNPNFVFDVHKSDIVDSYLSVVAQTFMDSCSTSDQLLGKDSPSSKLLYAKDIPKYKELVERYYRRIKLMPAISDQDMKAVLAEESRLHASEFNTNWSLDELYKYAVKYKEELMVTLEEDEFSRKQGLAYKLEQVHYTMLMARSYF